MVVSLLVILDAQAGWAFYTSTGVGRGGGMALTLSGPASVSAAQSSANAVSIAWSKPSGFPDQQLDRYFVRRRDGYGSVDVCGSSAAAPISGLSCVDTSAPVGTFTYEVRTSFRSWSSAAASSSPVSVVSDPPTVVSITLSSTDPTNAASVAWAVKFSESVSGVTAANFTLVATGISGATIGSVTGSGSTWTVNASTGTGAGTLALNLAQTIGITNAAGATLAAGYNGPGYTLRSFFPASFVLTDGGQPNRIDAGDTLGIALSAGLTQSSLCGAWTDNTVNQLRSDAVVTVVDGGAGNDSLTFTAAGCPTLRLGTVSLGSTGYVSGGNATLAATIRYTVATRTILVTFGVKSGTGSTGVVGGSPVATFTPNAALTSITGAPVFGTITSTGRF